MVVSVLKSDSCTILLFLNVLNRFYFSVPMSPIAALMMSLARNPNNYRYATCMFNDTMSTRVVGRIDFRQFVSQSYL